MAFGSFETLQEADRQAGVGATGSFKAALAPSTGPRESPARVAPPSGMVRSLLAMRAGERRLALKKAVTAELFDMVGFFRVWGGGLDLWGLQEARRGFHRGLRSWGAWIGRWMMAWAPGVQGLGDQ